MKKIYLLITTLFFCANLLMAQNAPNRTVQTIVADIAAQFPAETTEKYNKLIEELISTGEPGILLLMSSIQPPGPVSNANVDYALNGLSYYVTAKGQEDARLVVESAYIKALAQVENSEIKAFIIRQLQIVGQKNSIQPLSSYLSIENLGGPAARALASINIPEAEEALRSALLRRMGSAETQKDIILAIGEAEMTGAEEIVRSFISSPNADIRKAAFYAIGRIGSIASLKEVGLAAKAVGYTIEKDGANEAYIRLIKQIALAGDIKSAESAASALSKDAEKVGQTHTRSAALQILMSIDEKNATKLLLTAMKDSNKEYRNAALSYASEYVIQQDYITIINAMSKANSEAKIDIINWLGRENDDPAKNSIIKNLNIGSNLSARQTIANQLKDNNFEVKQAAARALVKIGDESATPMILSLLTDTDIQVAMLARDALITLPGDVSSSVAQMIPLSSDAGKVAVIQVLAARKASSYINIVLEQTKSASPNVKIAAYKALKDVAATKDFTLFCDMLESATDTSTIAPLQQAIIATLLDMAIEDKYSSVNNRMLSAGSGKRHLYYIVLSAAGDKRGLGTIVKAFKEERGEAKDAAFDALLAWRGMEIANELFTICKEADVSADNYFNRAFSSYIVLVSNTSITGENRLLSLRKAMEIARTDDQKRNTLRRIERSNTYLALLYAGEFLDQQPIQQAAANAVMNIALNNKEYTGNNVRALLNRVIAVLDNPDAQYQKEAIRKHLSEMPEEVGFVSLFNGKDLTGWKGLVENPILRAKMAPDQLALAQVKADAQMRADWRVENGLLLFDGQGYDNLCSVKQYGDIEMYVDWLLDPSGKEADAGIYLRGAPQVQIWDTARVAVGAEVGSGGLYNNRVHPSKPLKVADNKLGEWNTLYIKMVGDRVTVRLNGELVTDNVIMENYWDRNLPIFPIEQLELQAHGSKVYYRDIYVKELERPEPFTLSAQEKEEGYQILFDGTNMHEWTGNVIDYKIEDGTLIYEPGENGGNIYTKKEYDNFVFRFEFQLTPAANNGLGIRTPMEGDAAYVGMELQILDTEHPIYANLQPYQAHGSVYGIIAAERGHLKPVGEWNYQEVIANGDNIKITLNGHVIVAGNIRDATINGTIDKREHPGLFNKQGHIAFLGHDSPVKFRNIRVKEL
jgi:FOG: HEAT repeat